MESAPSPAHGPVAIDDDKSGAISCLRRGLVGGSLVWAAALPLATYAAAQPSPSALAYVSALVVYAVGGAVCHQLGPRSFYMWGHQMPVCARCTGIYFGAAMAAVTTALVVKGRPSAPGRLIVGIATLPLAASLVYEWTTGDVPSNVTRAATGIVLGAAVGWLVVSGTSAANGATTTGGRSTDTM